METNFCITYPDIGDLVKTTMFEIEQPKISMKMAFQSIPEFIDKMQTFAHRKLRVCHNFHILSCRQACKDNIELSSTKRRFFHSVSAEGRYLARKDRLTTEKIIHIHMKIMTLTRKVIVHGSLDCTQPIQIKHLCDVPSFRIQAMS